MSLHLLAYTGASSTTEYTQVPAITDVVTSTNNNYLLNNNMNLYAAYVQGANLSGARVNTPSLRQTVLPQLRPFVVGTSVPNIPPLCIFPMTNPLVLKGGEEIKTEAYISTSDTAVFVGLVIGDTITPAPQGQVYKIKAESTTAAVASTWTQLALSFDDTLPFGNYAIVGLEVENSTGVFARVIVPGQTSYRPGGLCINAIGNRTHPLFQNGNLGQWTTFNGFTMFSVEVLCVSTDDAHIVWADIVKVS